MGPWSAKSISDFQTNMAQKPYPSRVTHTYIAYTRKLPLPPTPGINTMLQDVLRFVHTAGDQAVCLFDPGIEITIFPQLWALLMHPA